MLFSRSGRSALVSGLTVGLFLLGFQGAASVVVAPAPVDTAAVLQARHDSINASFHYQSGRVQLPGTLGYIDVPAGMRFLDSAQTHYVLERLWGNPPDSSPLGMLLPVGSGPDDNDAWAFEVNYSDLGYVEDDDADDINYDELLKDMQHETVLENASRVATGYDPITLLGWASPPYYDKEHHVLHWAQLLRFGESGPAARRTLNYDVRILGRKGVLRLVAIGSPAQLPVIKAQIPSLIARAHFTKGLEYADYDPGMDDVAAYSLGGLVAGKVLAKVGFFALILKFWKVLIAGAAGIWALVRRWFASRQE